MFLSLNFMFMFVEIVYGYLSNSLSLMADAGHMLFDCSALVIGLYGSFMSTWKPNHKYSFGCGVRRGGDGDTGSYGRYEVICGFTNGILLVFVSLMIFTEGVERLMSTPEVRDRCCRRTADASAGPLGAADVRRRDGAHGQPGRGGGVPRRRSQPRRPRLVVQPRQ